MFISDCLLFEFKLHWFYRFFVFFFFECRKLLLTRIRISHIIVLHVNMNTHTKNWNQNMYVIHQYWKWGRWKWTHEYFGENSFISFNFNNVRYFLCTEDSLLLCICAEQIYHFICWFDILLFHNCALPLLCDWYVFIGFGKFGAQSAAAFWE